MFTYIKGQENKCIIFFQNTSVTIEFNNKLIYIVISVACYIDIDEIGLKKSQAVYTGI